MYFLLYYRKNVGYASTCNSVGQTAGYFLGYVVFVAFESADFCNKYLRSQPEPFGLLTLSGTYIYFVKITRLMFEF
jgi:PAT family acetyl-CoA transporter-like MFS transporter 1